LTLGVSSSNITITLYIARFFCLKSRTADSFFIGVSEIRSMEILEKILRAELEKVCDPLDLDIVELFVKRGKNGLHIKVIIYRGSGVTIRDCEKVSNLFNSRLSMLGQFDNENYNLQVSSPGLYRELRDTCEYSLFLTRPVKLILKEPDPSLGNAVCLTGILEAYKDNTVVLNENGKLHRIPLSRIKKTKLNG